MTDRELANQKFYIDPESKRLMFKIGIKAGQPAGHRRWNGYIIVGFKGKPTPAHRIIWLILKGTWEKQLDHINRIRDDNRIENLRPCTASQNQMNRSMVMPTLSGHRGVGFKKGKWVARIMLNGKKYWLGRHVKKQDAINAYLKKRKELFGEFA